MLREQGHGTCASDLTKPRFAAGRGKDHCCQCDWAGNVHSRQENVLVCIDFICIILSAEFTNGYIIEYRLIILFAWHTFEMHDDITIRRITSTMQFLAKEE